MQPWPPSVNDGPDPDSAEPRAGCDDERRHAAAGGAGDHLFQAATEAGGTDADMDLDDSATATKKGLLL